VSKSDKNRSRSKCMPPYELIMQSDDRPFDNISNEVHFLSEVLDRGTDLSSRKQLKKKKNQELNGTESFSQINRIKGFTLLCTFRSSPFIVSFFLFYF